MEMNIDRASCFLVITFTLALGCGCSYDEGTSHPRSTECLPDTSCDVVGVGGWNDIRRDEDLWFLKAYAESREMIQLSVEKIADAYPNLTELQLSCSDGGSHVDEPFDCCRFSSLTNLAVLALYTRSPVKNIDYLFDELRFSHLIISGGDRKVFSDWCEPMPPAQEIGDFRRFFNAEGEVPCKVEIEEHDHFCCEGIVCRWATFRNENDVALKVKCLPSQCNAIDFIGDFDLTDLEPCPNITTFSWSMDGDGFKRRLEWLTNERFPNLSYLVLSWDSYHNQELDVSCLSTLPQARLIELYFDNIIPRGLESLQYLPNGCALRFIISRYPREPIGEIEGAAY